MPSPSSLENQNGATLLEILAALGLLALLITLSTPALIATRALHEQIGDARDRLERKQLIEDTIRYATDHAYALRGINLVSSGADVAGAITSSLPPGHRPAQNSEALYVIVTDQSVEFQTRSSSGGNLHGCLSSRTQGAQSGQWIGISLSGPTLFAATLLQTAELCDTTLTPSALPFAVLPPFEYSTAHHALVAYRIDEAYLLFRDRENSFRRVGVFTHESQPIARGLTSFNVTETTDLLTVTLEVDDEDRTELRFLRGETDPLDYLDLIL